MVVVTLSVVGHGTENDNITIPGTESQNVVNLLKVKVPAFSGAQTQVVFAASGQQSVTSSANETAIETAIKQLAKVPQVAQVTNPILNKSISPDGKVALATLLWNTPAANVQNSSLSDMQTAAAPAQQAGLQVDYGGAVYPDWNPKLTETPEIIGIIIAFFILLITFSSAHRGPAADPERPHRRRDHRYRDHRAGRRVQHRDRLHHGRDHARPVHRHRLRPVHLVQAPIPAAGGPPAG